jgi:hypothetical protein
VSFDILILTKICQSEIKIYCFNTWVLKLLHQNAWEKNPGKGELMVVSREKNFTAGLVQICFAKQCS